MLAPRNSSARYNDLKLGLLGRAEDGWLTVRLPRTAARGDVVVCQPNVVSFAETTRLAARAAMFARARGGESDGDDGESVAVTRAREQVVASAAAWRGAAALPQEWAPLAATGGVGDARLGPSPLEIELDGA